MNRFTPLIILAFVVFIAYGYTLNQYFWHDDYSHLYLVQQGESSPYPYHLNTLMVKVLWNLLKLNPKGYFAVGIALYLGATYLVFWLAKIIFQKKFVAISLGLVFASGYIGQDSMKMFLGDGVMVIVGMIFVLLSIISFIKYKKKLKKSWLVLSLIFFFLALEVAPHRYAGLLVIMLGLDWLDSWRKKRKLYELLARNLIFLSVFLIQYVFHPLRLLFGYPLATIPIVREFQIDYVINVLGSFWSLIFPYEYQYRLYLKSFWILTLALVVFYALVFLFIKLLRRKISSFRLLIYFTLILVVVLAGGHLSFLASKDPMTAISATNGISFLGFLFFLLLLKIPKYKLMAIFSLILIFGSLSIFFLIKPELMLESSNRYLMASAFGLPFLCSFFLSEEFVKKKTSKCTKRLAAIIFLLPISLLVLLRLSAGVSSQREFIDRYSQHAYKIFAGIRKELPEINGKTLIYIEGATRELNYSVGDAFRVGRLGPEAAVAVHYLTKIDNIILPEYLEEIPKILKQDPKLDYKDVYTFIYDGVSLRNTSEDSRAMLEAKPKPLLILADKWRPSSGKTLSYYPDRKISTMLLLKVKTAVLSEEIPNGSTQENTAQKGTIVFGWKYNTYGNIFRDKSVNFELPLDNQWHQYEFSINAGGEYLEELSVDYSLLHNNIKIIVGETRIDYLP